MKQLGAKRPLIVTDQGVAAAGLIALVKKALDGTGIPSDAHSIEAIKLIRNISRKFSTTAMIAGQDFTWPMQPAWQELLFPTRAWD